MFTFVIGVAVGAAFSKFWIGMYEAARDKINQVVNR